MAVWPQIQEFFVMRHDSKFKVYWAAIRPKESIMMLGVPSLGLLFAQPALHVQLLERSFLLLFCGLLIASHIYTLNDLLGMAYDVHDQHKIKRPLLAKQMGVGQLWLFSLALGFFGYGVLLWLEKEVFWLALSLTLLWLVYSLPRGLKGYPVLTSAINSLGAGIIPFLIGYVFVRGWSWHGFLLSLYFGLIAGAGQINREILDIEPDAKANLVTTAVWLGATKAFHCSFFLFVCSGVYLFFLSRISPDLPNSIGIAALCVQPLHWLAYHDCKKSGLADRQNLNRYITRYRDLYAALGVVYGLLLFQTLLWL